MAKVFRANVNPRLLRWARESAGMQLEEAARLIPPKSVDALRAWETGEKKPTIKQARDAAKVYKRPFSVLYFDEPPKEPDRPTDFRRRDVDDPSEFTSELRFLIREVRNKQRWLSDWASSSGRPQLKWVGSWPRPSDPAALAERLIESLDVSPADLRGISRQDAFTLWYDRVEMSGVAVFRSRVVSPDEARGFAFPDPFAPVVFVNSRDSLGAQIFTLIHEVAHLWLGAGGVSNPIRDGKFPKGVARIEQFCNRVTADVLMPPRAANRVLAGLPSRASDDERVSELSSVFKVSKEAAARRLLDLGLIDQHFYDTVRKQGIEDNKRRLAEEKAKAKARKKPIVIPVPTKVIAKHGASYVDAVLGALRVDAIKEHDVLRLLDAKPKHLEAIEQDVLSSMYRRGLG